MKLVLIKHIGLLMILFMVSFDAIASNDTIVAQHITDSLQYHNISITSNHTDSINNSTDSIYDNNYWLRELKRGKIHLDDEKVHYPSVISWGWHTMKKINKLLNNFDTTYVASTGKNFKLTLKNNNWFDDYDYHIGDMTILFHSQMTCNLGAQLSFLVFREDMKYLPTA